ncbi:putative pentatricopeptide [Medicago truncatula]|uniref:Putative pentatricopeptide n=1 Tax=Medicago truncatula TaxID=3880 RepID=A0A396I4T9_MEDTR|nr:putative pentatricopeptide [Medicago truncatula]
MEKAGVRPNQVEFLSILSACSHRGLVEEGLEFFGKMVNDYGLVADVKHHDCVIDMLGRVGRLEEAEKVALQVPREVANDVIWRTLLGACSVHDNVEVMNINVSCKGHSPPFQRSIGRSSLFCIRSSELAQVIKLNVHDLVLHCSR